MSTNVAPDTAKLQLVNSSQVNISDITAVVNQILKGSNSSAILSKTHQTFATSEVNINNCFQTFHKLSALVTHLNYQQEAITKSIKQTDEVIGQIAGIKVLCSKLTPN
uniref:BLOC-1-related complex subunit 7 n=1 Tax=Ciona savignyi TaxID=51511 RepID=H2YIA1_CIOSA